MSTTTLSARDSMLAVGVMVVWGANFAVTKVAVEDAPVMLLILIRFLMVAVLIVPFVKIPYGNLKELFFLSVTLGVLHFLLMFNGLARVDASVAAIAVQVQVPFAAMLGWLLFREYVGWKRIGGMVLAFVGVSLLAGEPETASHIDALLMVFGGALVWAIAAIQMKRLSNVSVMQLNGWMAVFAVPQLLIATVVFEGTRIDDVVNLSWVAWSAAAYMAIVVVIIGYGFWAWFLKRYPVNQVMPFSLLAPVFGMMSGWLTLGEPTTPERIIGAIITLIGVGIIVVDPSVFKRKTS